MLCQWPQIRGSLFSLIVKLKKRLVNGIQQNKRIQLVLTHQINKPAIDMIAKVTKIVIEIGEVIPDR